MPDKSETSLGTQVIVALIVLFIAWVVLKWVVRVVMAVAMSVVVAGAVLFAAWIIFGKKSGDS